MFDYSLFFPPVRYISENVTSSAYHATFPPPPALLRVATDPYRVYAVPQTVSDGDTINLGIRAATLVRQARTSPLHCGHPSPASLAPDHIFPPTSSTSPSSSSSPSFFPSPHGGGSNKSVSPIEILFAGVFNLGVPMAEWSKTLDFESELKIAQVQILSVTVALFISTIDLVLYRPSPLFCLIRSSHNASTRRGASCNLVHLLTARVKQFTCTCQGDRVRCADSRPKLGGGSSGVATLTASLYDTLAPPDTAPRRCRPLPVLKIPEAERSE
ncbi:hypothetical protein J6590_023424 [Homalodisca vitripennis]|nr:hypothetical protein J6590_023424 [Homalodisca vitripennis]